MTTLQRSTIVQLGLENVEQLKTLKDSLQQDVAGLQSEIESLRWERDNLIAEISSVKKESPFQMDHTAERELEIVQDDCTQISFESDSLRKHPGRPWRSPPSAPPLHTLWLSPHYDKYVLTSNDHTPSSTSHYEQQTSIPNGPSTTDSVPAPSQTQPVVSPEKATQKPAPNLPKQLNRIAHTTLEHPAMIRNQLLRMNDKRFVMSVVALLNYLKKNNPKMNIKAKEIVKARLQGQTLGVSDFVTAQSMKSQLILLVGAELWEDIDNSVENHVKSHKAAKTMGQPESVDPVAVKEKALAAIMAIAPQQSQATSIVSTTNKDNLKAPLYDGGVSAFEEARTSANTPIASQQPRWVDPEAVKEKAMASIMAIAPQQSQATNTTLAQRPSGKVVAAAEEKVRASIIANGSQQSQAANVAVAQQPGGFIATAKEKALASIMAMAPQHWMKEG